MLSNGKIIFSILQIKLSSVQLARKYMKRVSSELDALSGPEKEPNREFLILQGVRFAFRVHQVCFVSASVSVNLYFTCSTVYRTNDRTILFSLKLGRTKRKICSNVNNKKLKIVTSMETTF